MTESREDTNPLLPRAWRTAAVRLLVVLGLTCLLGLAAVWASDPSPNTFVYELGKALLQLLTVIVIGGGLTLVTSNYQREHDELRESEQRERDEYRESQQRARDEHRDLQERSDTVLRELLGEALKSYHDVKRARRVLRGSRSRTPEGEHVDLVTYEAQIAVINDAQLDFERMKILARLIRDGRVDAQLLVKRFNTIEKYLSELLTEYEQARKIIESESRLALKDLEHLNGCIDETRRYIFRRGVANPIKAIVTQLQAALVVPLPSGGQEVSGATSQAETATN
jgi:hypothetical protein